MKVVLWSLYVYTHVHMHGAYLCMHTPIKLIFKEGDDDDDDFHGKIRVKIVDQQFLGMLIETLSKWAEFWLV